MSANPRVVGRYLLFDSFAAGGMATVHLARLLGPRGFSRAVAIKQLHPQFATNAEFVAMLLDEAKLASRVRHSNVVSPLDVVAVGSELFVVMDYIHGESLARLLRQSAGPLPIPIVSAVITQALLGLHAAHEATGASGEPLNMVHRDVSPQNVLVGEDGVARVVDFGIAKPQAWSRTTHDGFLKGKLGYMAPEQIGLEAVDRRTDIFTAGIVLWEMLTGARLFGADTLTEVAEQMRHVEREVSQRDVPALPQALRDVALRALAREPRLRYQSAREMAAAVAAVVPPASALEVAAWVTHLAGAELRERAQRLALLEAFNTDEWSTPSRRDVPSLAQPRMLLPVGGDEATPSAVSVVPPPRKKRSFRKLGLALAAAAGVSLLAAGWLWRSPAPEATLAAARPASTAEVPLAAASAEQPVIPSATTPLVVPQGGMLTLPEKEPSATVAPTAHVASLTPAKPLAQVEPQQLRALGAAPLTPGTASKAVPAPAPTAHRACDVPFTIGADGVKRFKPECF